MAGSAVARRLQEVFGSDSEEEGEEALGCGMDEREQRQRIGALHFTSASPQWEEAGFAEGLWLCRGFLSAAQQEYLLSCIQEERWFDPPLQNQHMRFGSLPHVAVDLSLMVRQAVCSFDLTQQGGHPVESTIATDSCLQGALLSEGDRRCFTDVHRQEAAEGSSMSQFWEAGTDSGRHRATPGKARDSAGPFPEALLARQPLFDQMIANWYAPSEGIRAHVDLLRFDDGIAIISLLSPCVMSFARAYAPGPSPNPCLSPTTAGKAQGTPMQSTQQPSCKRPADAIIPEEAAGAQVQRPGRVGEAPQGQALLQPGDLLLLWGEARYLWSHAIVRDGPLPHQQWRGGQIACQERISVTLRKLTPDED